MRVVGMAVAAVLVCLAGVAGAQDAPSEDELVVPPPPDGSEPAPLAGAVPIEDVVAPLLAAAEADLSAGRAALALARASMAAEVLPPDVPMRVRAESLRVLAAQRVPEGTRAPPMEEVCVPLIAQADLDLRAGRPELALPRLELALARLPRSAALFAHVLRLRDTAARMTGTTPAPTPDVPLPPPLPPPPRAPDGLRGTGEIIELYITAAALGVLSGAYLPFMISGARTDAETYPITMAAGAGLLAIGVLTLDHTLDLPSGLPPTIAASIRFGFAHGMLSWGLYLSQMNGRVADGGLGFSLIWGGTILGTLTGLVVGFGLTPTVGEERLVESTGYWGMGLATTAAILTEFDDAGAGLALMLVGLDAGLLIGMLMTAMDAVPSVGRTLFLDLGFFGGAAVGALIPGLYYAYSDDRLEAAPFGVGMLIGSIGGWALAYFLTEGMDASAAPSGEPSMRIGVSPLEGGASVTASGVF